MVQADYIILCPSHAVGDGGPRRRKHLEAARLSAAAARACIVTTAIRTGAATPHTSITGLLWGELEVIYCLCLAGGTASPVGNPARTGRGHEAGRRLKTTPLPVPQAGRFVGGSPASRRRGAHQQPAECGGCGRSTVPRSAAAITTPRRRAAVLLCAMCARCAYIPRKGRERRWLFLVVKDGASWKVMPRLGKG